MELLLLFAVPGVLGGIIIAFFFVGLNRESHARAAADPFSREPLSTDVINAARIRVAGVGGLGLVAIALGVAVSIPRIGLSLTLGLVLGALWAAVLIRRRREGPMPSSGRRPGANTTLSIDAPSPPVAAHDDHRSNVSTRKVPALSAVPARLV
jgi:hypothetical protein